jgi:Cu(I)/Ag(I) efflux system membrane protein CusA/SilA
MFARETGSEIIKPIATPIVGGMITATLLNLFLVPVLFSWLKERELTRRST